MDLGNRAIEMQTEEWVNDSKADSVTFEDLGLPGWNIALKPVPIKEKTEGGILLPGTFHNDASYLANVCEVVKMGPKAYDNEEVFGDPWCKVGDYVVIGRHVGMRFKYKGVKLILVKEKDILFTVNEPADVDSTFDL